MNYKVKQHGNIKAEISIHEKINLRSNGSYEIIPSIGCRRPKLCKPFNTLPSDIDSFPIDKQITNILNGLC
jgi:hypothetical protein